MPPAAHILDHLFAERAIDLERAAFLVSPPPAPAGPLDWGRVEGMMLGLAVGDALGSSCAAATPAVRRSLHGEVRNYLPNRSAADLPYGLPSDDTQLAFWTLECLLEDGGRLDPEHLLERFAAGTLYGGGAALGAALRAWRGGLRPWYRAGQASAGNGALMRIAPLVIPWLKRPSAELGAATALAAVATHNDRASTSACLAWVAILWQALAMPQPPDPLWWPEAYVEVARALEGESRYATRPGLRQGYEGPLWRFCEERLADAWRRGLSAAEACEEWGSGAYLLETVPSVLYILMRHAADPEEALVRAVNDTYDNDTIAAIVGSAVGALHGRQALPARWLDGLSGRTRADDAGHVFVLLDRARRAFWEGDPARTASASQTRDDAPPEEARPGPADPAADGSVPLTAFAPQTAFALGDPTPTPAVPYPRAYWVLPGRFLAGEYPGAKDALEAGPKLRAFLAAGVDLFIDLTAADEPLEPYAPLLAEEAAALGRRAEHRRMGIHDYSVPTPAFLADILDAIDAALAEGRTVYLHCLGGIGRTGTVVGAYLARHGLRGDQALERVQALLNTTPKAGRPSPETAAQVAMVRSWAEHDRPPLRQRFRGSLLGLAAGDALGTTLEFSARGERTVTDIVGGGPFGLPPGYWTDDTSMALCLADSLLASGGFDPRDQLDRYVRWWQEGYLSSTGKCFDIGTTTVSALRRYLLTADPYAGAAFADLAGNGSLMRLAPVPLYYYRDAQTALSRAADSSRTTHGAMAAIDACRYYAGLIVGALRGARKEELLAPCYAPVPGYWRARPLCAPIEAIARGSFLAKGEADIDARGYVVSTLEAALWAFAHSDSFEEGALKAVNLAQDADSTGAVYGQLAGAFYGEEGIPPRWRAVLARADLITSFADGLYEAAEAQPWAS